MERNNILHETQFIHYKKWSDSFLYRVVLFDKNNNVLITQDGKVCNILYTSDEFLFETLPSVDNLKADAFGIKLAQEIPKIKNDKIYSRMLGTYGSKIKSMCNLIKMCFEFPNGTVRFYKVN